MGAITLDGILKIEHEVIRTAIDEWLGMGDKPAEDLQWVMGVNDFASKLIDKLEGKDGNNGS